MPVTLALRLSWLFARPGRVGLASVVLPIIAFMTVTGILLIVLGGAQEFWTWSDGDGFFYQAAAVVALTIMVVPLSSLGAAAARLSARRRDDRLATLRLLGATPALVTALSVIESVVLATIGALGGVLLALAASPAIGLIPFRGSALGTAAVQLAPGVTVLAVVGVTTLAAVSAIIGLRRVIISPLGVRSRDVTPRPHWVRVLVAVGVVTITSMAMGVLGNLGFAVILWVLALGFGGTLLVLNLIGPWVLTLIARGQARRAKTPDRLLAARGILESPKAAWTQVSGVAMTSFVAVVAGCAVGLLDSLEGSENPNDFLLGDIRTGVLITVIASFLMVACSVGVNQSAAILDRRDLYSSLGKLGMPTATMERARRRTVMGPLSLTAIGSATVAGVVLFPLTGATLLFAPLTLVVIAAVLAAGILLVWLSLLATKPILVSATAS